jgi:hypothetical protein
MKVLLLYKKGKEVERFYPQKRSNLIGRSPSCDFVVRAKGLKPIHYLLEWIGVGEFDPENGMWSILDISSSEKDMMSGEGIILTDQQLNLGDFHFAIKEDNIAPSAFTRGVLSRTLQNQTVVNLGARSDGSVALEVVYVRKDINAVSNVKHLSRRIYNTPMSLFPTHQPLKFLWDQQNVGVGFLESRGNLDEFKLLNRGEDVTSSLLSGDRRVRFQTNDFLLLKSLKADYYLRIVPGVAVKEEAGNWLKDSMVQSLLASAFIILCLYLWILKNPYHSPVPENPARVARVEVAAPAQVAPLKKPEPPPPPPPPPPEPPKIELVPTTVVAKPQPLPVKAGVEKAKPQKVAQVAAQKPEEIPSSDVNTMGLLGRLKPTAKSAATVSADEVLNQRFVSDTATGKTGLVIRKPPMGTISNATTNQNTPDLASAGSTLKSGRDLVGSEQTGSLNIKGAKFAAGSNLGTKSTGVTDTFDLGGGFEISGGLDKEAVRATIKENRRGIKNCYDTALLQNRDMAGRLMYIWKISGQGDVETVQLVATDFSRIPLPSKNMEALPDFERCIGFILQQMQFPRALNNLPTVVKYPFVFKGR